MMLVDPFRFAGSNPATLEFVHSAEMGVAHSTGYTVYIPAFPIGGPRGDRRVFLIHHVHTYGALGDLMGGNIGGQPLTIHAQQKITFGTGWLGLVTISSAHVPLGVEADIALDFSDTIGVTQALATFRATDLRQTVAFDARQMIGNTPARNYPMIISTPQDGLILAAGTIRLAGDRAEVQGTTTYYSYKPSNYGRFGGGGLTIEDPDHELIFSMIGGESFHTMEGAFVAASFR